jgi:hypothetical protein
MLGSEEGEIEAAITDAHLVQLTMPEYGFGQTLDTMVEFFLEHGEELRVGWILKNSDREAQLLFCFQDFGNATKFAQQFCGVILEDTFYDADPIFPWLCRPSAR